MCHSKVDFTAGNLAKHYKHWEKLTNNSTVINWIRDGVSIPFHNIPQKFELPNRSLKEKYKQFVSDEIKQLLTQGAIEKLNYKPYCVSPIGVVPKKGNKLRLICDLRQLNSVCQPPKFIYENIDTALELVHYKDEFISVDLKNGFHHVPVNLNDRKYLGFSWEGIYYQWNVLPFGLSSSPYFFCKILKPIVGWLREKGLRVIIYVDDILLIASHKDIESHRHILLDTLKDLGWFIKHEKCNLIPNTKIKFIGYTLDSIGDTSQPVLRINSERIRRLSKCLKHLLQNNSCTKRHLARVAGQCVSMSKAILPAKLLLRNTYRLISKYSNWDATLKLDNPTISDLKWWITALKSWNGLILKPHRESIQMETDASATGWGCCIDQQETFGLWDRSMANMPSNFRELSAVYLGIKSFSAQLQGKALTVLTDNIVTTAYLNHLGGPVQSLTNLAQAIWAIVFKLDISLRAHHLPGVLNVQADRLSRKKYLYEWKLHPELFQHIDKTFGPHTIDRFASFQTRQLPRYNSISYDPETEGIDALSQNNWGQEVNFVNPPFRLIPQVLKTVNNQSARATLIAPYWPGQVWFKLLESMTTRPPIPVPNNRKAIQYFGIGAEPLKNRKWKIYAWQIHGQNNCVPKVGQKIVQKGYPCVGHHQHCKHITDSYNTLQSFVNQDTVIFRPPNQV